jgi:putative RecB family exonuclease
MPRVQSPSSINIYKQCPRKYYYLYIERRKTKPSIHLVRGTVVHETLEAFFQRPVQPMTGALETDLQFHALTILKERWLANNDEVASLGMTAAEITSYKEETTLMVLNWVRHFMETVQREINTGLTYEEAFARHTPRIEEEYINHELQVRGYIDAIHERDGEVHIRDYKTSKKPIISEEYKTQLGIYALLYQKTHGIVPDTVGIFFLKHGEQLLSVNDELLKAADVDIRWVHERTQSDEMSEYPKRLQPLCKWCDFYEECWNQKELSEF